MLPCTKPCEMNRNQSFFSCITKGWNKRFSKRRWLFSAAIDTATVTAMMTKVIDMAASYFRAATREPCPGAEARRATLMNPTWASKFVCGSLFGYIDEL